MFTGIISSIGTIASTQQDGDLSIVIACDYALETLKMGESIACNGACLTVVEKGIRDWALGIRETSNPQSPMPNACFTAQLSAETVARTAPGQWQEGKRVNLERALKLGDALDGHMVTGHIDGLATLQEITPSGDSFILSVDAPPALARFIAEKGSVTLDGVALTVNKIMPSSSASIAQSGDPSIGTASRKMDPRTLRAEDDIENCRFWVNIIPHTWHMTTLGERKPGEALNLEIDLIARYIDRLVNR